uniref:NADH-ubiquinone oxidoreductase chain 3 n=1 Tax=Paraconotrochus antarcticus TaxID=2666516 RepID=A0A7T1S059_9CNID|nr:NADH dehydrogenase subunit 3 [Paraconotrochus antarcticus]QPO84683.1 NADH dehydrogenase subunit 3 [Paraconotrochus antarcticus]
MQADYFSLFILLSFSAFLSIIFFFASYFFGEKKPDREKISSYECGFLPFGAPGSPFSVRFFLIGILFLVFDLEISYLFPWCVLYNQISPFAYWGMIGFLGVLVLGLVYEWLKGALEWE